MKNRSIFGRWLWEAPALIPFVLACVIIPFGITAILHPIYGDDALKIMYFAFLGPFFLIGFGFVGMRVAKLRNSVTANDRPPMDCLVLNGLIQIPGIALINDSQLILIPIFGRRIELAFNEIRSYKESCWFNGKLFLFKRGFMLKVPERSRIGFAVPQPLDKDIRRLFRNVTRH